MRYLTLCLFAGALIAAINDPVKLDSGAISGAAGSNPEVRVYKGIPYAAPPVGDLRWKSPKPVTKWDGVKKADAFGSTCMQSPYPEGSPYHGPAEATSEDCLYLNVWTAAKSAKEKRPVMVWIHGGALTRGSGSTPVYDGEKFAEKGVVLVTINYRLGIFGYFAHPELTKESDRNASGNYGFLDQIAALEWVQRNIAAFGGDSKRVTIFGESAGSWSVNVLVASPLTKGLFARAIGESGAQFGRVTPLAQAEAAGMAIAKRANANSIAELRAKSAEDLMKLTVGASSVVDGYFLPQDVKSIYAAGKQNDVPLLIGSNADEGTAFTPPNVQADGFRKTAKSRYGDDADAYLKIYPASSDDEAHKSSAQAMRDQTFGWEMRTWARMQNQTGKSKVYVYYFSKVPPGEFGPKLGAYHASEIGYVFETLQGGTDTDHKLSDEMSSYWVNFATAGDPNGKSLPKWPVFDKTEMAMGLGDKVEPIPVPNKAGLDFLDAHQASSRPGRGAQ
ncbi:MAG TPA: carboxylesterase family protein [Bryobacteraceae bacterium]